MKAGAWVKQIASQVAKHGAEYASWYCEWDEPDGTRRCKSCGPGRAGRNAAERMAKRIRAELLTGTYNRQEGVTWDAFRTRYQKNIIDGRSFSSRETILKSLKAFETALNLKGKLLAAITTDRVADFVSKRRAQRGKKPGSKISPATINRDLRHVKAALRTAAEWGMLEAVPKFRFEREPRELPRYVTPEHFAALYDACSKATVPSGLHCSAAAWWRGLVVMGQMTGWRIGEMLSLEWNDVDLDAGTAITRARSNKGKRDEVVALHPVVVEHLRPLKTFAAVVFPWDDTRKALLNEFHRLQGEAGISLDCRIQREHEHTDACLRYGFHDLRRAFATMNAANMSREALQALMRHASSLTTERYINYARQMNPAVAGLHVPDVLKMKAAN